MLDIKLFDQIVLFEFHRTHQHTGIGLGIISESVCPLRPVHTKTIERKLGYVLGYKEILKEFLVPVEVKRKGAFNAQPQHPPGGGWCFASFHVFCPFANGFSWEKSSKG